LRCMLEDIVGIAFTQFKLEEKNGKTSHHKALQALA